MYTVFMVIACFPNALSAMWRKPKWINVQYDWIASSFMKMKIMIFFLVESGQSGAHPHSPTQSNLFIEGFY